MVTNVSKNKPNEIEPIKMKMSWTLFAELMLTYILLYLEVFMWVQILILYRVRMVGTREMKFASRKSDYGVPTECLDRQPDY